MRISRDNGAFSAVSLSHLLLREKVSPGDRVVDATCGNGHDTLFLAGLVGPDGKVYAFDVQDEALSATRALLEDASLLCRVELVHAGHENLAQHVAESCRAVIFNLGYLPGGDKTRITRPETTIPALEQAAELVMPGGIVLIAVYPGHPGGVEESDAVDGWAEALSPGDWIVQRICRINGLSAVPYLVLVEKSQRQAQGIRKAQEKQLV